MGADVVGMGGQGGTPWFWWCFAIVAGVIRHAAAGGGPSRVEDLAQGLQLARGSWGISGAKSGWLQQLALADGIRFGFSSWLNKQLNSASLVVGFISSWLCFSL